MGRFNIDDMRLLYEMIYVFLNNFSINYHRLE